MMKKYLGIICSVSNPSRSMEEDLINLSGGHGERVAYLKQTPDNFEAKLSSYNTN
jgi:hypothetical protein